jgi:hypothetical protein
MRFADQSTVGDLFREFRSILRGASFKLLRCCLIVRAYRNIPILEVLIAYMLGLSSGEARQPAIVPSVATNQSPIAVSIAVLAKREGERLVIYRDPSTHFHVIVSNVSKTQQAIWSESCSMGYCGLSFELTGEDGKTSAVNRRPIIWTVNSPQWWTLEPGESEVIDVYFGKTNQWQGFPLPHRGSQTVTMRAVLSFDADNESRRFSVWTGRVVSKPEKITFYRWDPERSR